MKVLLVDDSTTMRKIQKRVLVSMDIDDIVEAGDGVEAIKQLEDNNYDFDFILLDINMPEMSGLETLRKIRSTPEMVKLPVIMCTSVAEKEQVMEAIKAGATNYVVKPFRPEELQKKIEAVIKKE